MYEQLISDRVQSWRSLQFCSNFWSAAISDSDLFQFRSLLFWWLAQCWSLMYGSWLEKDLQRWPPPPSSWGCGQQPSQRWPLSYLPSGCVRPKHHPWQRGCTRQWGWAPSSWEVTGMAITCCCGKCPIRSWHRWLSLTGSKKCSIFWNPWRLRPCTWLCNLMRTKVFSSSRSYREQWAFSSISTLWAFLLRPHSLLPSWHPWSRPSVTSKCRVLCILSLQGSFSIQRVSRVPVGIPTRVGQRVSSHLASKKTGFRCAVFHCL